MRVGLLVMGCGRGHYLDECIETLSPYEDDFAFKVLVDDSGRRDYVSWLLANRREGWHVAAHRRQRGLAAAVNTGWDLLKEQDLDYVFHVEEDFAFDHRPPISEMAAILEGTPRLGQLVLQRNPWNPQERAAGSVLELFRDEVTEHDGWCEWTKWFSLNPCLYPAAIMDLGWPPHGGEDEFTPKVLEAGWRLGVYGRIGGPPDCEHIGDQSLLFGGGGFL